MNDFRETDPMDVDHKGKSKGKGKGRGKSKSKGKSTGPQPKQRQKQEQQQREEVEKKPDDDKEWYVCGKEGHFARACWSRANHDKMVNEVEVENDNAEPGKEYVYTIEHEINDVNLSQDERETCLRGANGKPLQEYGKRQIWLKICGLTKRHDFHVVKVTKPILSVSCLCEQGVETH